MAFKAWFLLNEEDIFRHYYHHYNEGTNMEDQKFSSAQDLKSLSDSFKA